MAINDYKRTLLAVNKETNHPFDQPEDMEFLVYETTDNHVKLRVDGSEIDGGSTKKQFIVDENSGWDFTIAGTDIKKIFVNKEDLSSSLAQEMMAADEIIFKNIVVTSEGVNYDLNNLTLSATIKANNLMFRKIFGASALYDYDEQTLDFGSYISLINSGKYQIIGVLLVEMGF